MLNIVHVVAIEPVGGVGTFLKNSLTESNNYQLIQTTKNINSEFNKKMLEKNVKIHSFPNFYEQFNYFSYCKKWYKENAKNIDVVHIHSIAVALPHLYYAKKYNVKTRIYHVHGRYFTNVSRLKKIRNKIISSFSIRNATNLASCGKLVGDEIFGNKSYTILPNTIDTEKYKFNSDARKTIRQQLKLDEKIVIGMVGSLIKIKNHRLLLEIMQRLGNNYHLVIVGEGEEKESLVKLAGDNVTFVGKKTNIEDYYSAFDIFVLPSLTEGFPLVALEAQASGINCIFSNTIDRTVQLIENCQFIDITDMDAWINCLKNQVLLEENERGKVNDEVSNYANIRRGREVLDKYYRMV